MPNMKTSVVIALFSLASAAMADPDDLVIKILAWDSKGAKTITGWFTDSKKVRALQAGLSDSVPTRKAIEVARDYLLKVLPEIDERSAEDDDPFDAQEMPLSNRAKVKGWTFAEMSILPIDLGRGRGSLISWKPEESHQFFYALKFIPEFDGRTVNQYRTVVLLPNLEVVPFRKIPTTKAEKEQIVWWGRHVGREIPDTDPKEELIQKFAR